VQHEYLKQIGLAPSVLGSIFIFVLMKDYKQLTLGQRYQIVAPLKIGTTQTAIATIIGVNRSTDSRELKRNIPPFVVEQQVVILLNTLIKRHLSGILLSLSKF